ncbi:helix-turn-helix transcriptional regulator [Planotetraspora kaengkrachanensis]|uniref:Transcriptional regulator n=1 Tax=Planotetraspora kaengkrachanensis TaxID=575193 RepID=A0A8J3LTC6_9ACTN|nr:transcriptional regulator [Planotetraspora kaengkrachanensis]
MAELAGVSVDYYMRLEQGRERRPSEQVLGALARVFQLDPEAVRHLHDLARPRPPRLTPADRQVNPALIALMQGWDHPALVMNRRLDVLFENRLAALLCNERDLGPNLLRHAFYHPEWYQDWHTAANMWVAHLRATAGAYGGDPFVRDLIDELSQCGDFRRMWSSHDVRTNGQGILQLRHPDVGEVKLAYETLPVNSAPGQVLLVCESMPDSHAADSVAKLRELLT